MRIAAAALLALTPILASAPAYAQTQAPFCLVSNSGHPSCFYYTLDACRSAQGALGGICTANVQQQSQSTQPVQMHQALQYPDIAGSAMRGAQAGQEMRIREEQHRAQMQLLQAQRQQIAAPAAWQADTAVGIGSSGSPVYRCQLQSGGVYYTSHDIVGCTAIPAR